MHDCRQAALIDISNTPWYPRLGRVANRVKLRSRLSAIRNSLDMGSTRCCAENGSLRDLVPCL